MHENDLLNARAAAELLGVTVVALRSHRQKGTGPAYAKEGRNVRYRRRDLIAWRDAAPEREAARLAKLASVRASDEYRAKMSAAAKRQYADPGQRAKLSEAKRQEHAGYRGAHGRVRYDRGRAAEHTCPCGSPAQEWALDPSTPLDQLLVQRGGKDDGKLYSLSSDAYVAMCQSCHRALDAEQMPTLKEAFLASEDALDAEVAA